MRLMPFLSRYGYCSGGKRRVDQTPPITFKKTMPSPTDKVQAEGILLTENLWNLLDGLYAAFINLKGTPAAMTTGRGI